MAKRKTSDFASTAEIPKEPYKFDHLPAPFDDIRIGWDVSLSGVTIQYQGDASRLLEAGAIEPDMVGKAKTKVRPRLDSAGHYYNRDVRVAQRPLRAQLLVTRHITDPEFAKTLPGAPRILRFKFFDWLEPRPNGLHIETQKDGDKNVHTKIVGTVENLLAAGFHRCAFERKYPVHGRQLHLYRCAYIRDKDFDPRVLQFTIGNICPLMWGGYFCVNLYSEAEDRASSAADDANQGRRRHNASSSGLRLIIDNTK